MKWISIFSLLFVSTIPVAFGDAYIENDQQYIGDDGTFHIVGEIINNLQAPLNQISIHATLFDKDGQIIESKKTSSLVNTIMPGMKGPFDLILTNHNAKKVKSYSLDLDYNVSPPKNQVIGISESKLSMDNFNNLMITGTVSNKGETTANMISVIATMYDKDGKVVSVNRVNPEPDYLRSQDNAFFLVSIPDKIQTNKITEYSLVAESEEYAAVPEFPIGTAVVLILTLSAYIGITKFSGRIMINLISATNLK
ncbi:MAG: FxLYD domain-containing protein [Nitrosopumilus sp.]|uniref:FxLYD domain-containing protein n=1 Tax=Nitrosopumilus sp. TaxID=2024843 RepID=UPI00247D1397|nr:FxLYD domain-containing protein [Nitrosopumilus sp.]MCV0392597.1 FxLYD domain-containing protein [Nitrosopumilus sp.]